MSCLLICGTHTAHKWLFFELPKTAVNRAVSIVAQGFAGFRIKHTLYMTKDDEGINIFFYITTKPVK